MAERYDDDRHSKYVGLRLLLLAVVIMAAEALAVQTNVRRMTKFASVSYTHLTLPTKA